MIKKFSDATGQTLPSDQETIDAILGSMYSQLDIDGDGRVTLAEIVTVFEQMMPEEYSSMPEEQFSMYLNLATEFAIAFEAEDYTRLAELHFAINPPQDCFDSDSSEGEPVSVTIVKGPPVFEAAKEGNLELVRELVESGADINEDCEMGKTPVMIAAYEGYLEIVRLLAEQGVDINQGDAFDMTPMLMAAARGRLEVVQPFGGGAATG